MEKGGWLDQILLGILHFLNQTWLAIAVAIVGAFLVAYLAVLSPKGNWAFISEGPGKVLFGAFVVLAGLKSAPRYVVPETHFMCDQGPGPLGIEVTTNCRIVTEGSFRTVYDYTLVDFFKDFVTSLVSDAVFGAVGAVAGGLCAMIVVRSRRARSV